MKHRSETSLNFMDVLAEIVPRNVPVALLDFPWHSNPGDAAIWKGENLALTKLGHRVVYTSTTATFDRNRLDRLRAHDVIVTDRLHAMLFGLAYGRPVVAVDSGYGKINSYIDTFLDEEPLLHRVGTFDQLPETLDNIGSPQ